jgi:hypothetical protein
VNYNHLESSYLVTSVGILVLGMVFTSRGFPPGSFGFNALSVVATAWILGSTLVFVLLLVFEVRRPQCTLTAVVGQAVLGEGCVWRWGGRGGGGRGGGWQCWKPFRATAEVWGSLYLSCMAGA